MKSGTVAVWKQNLFILEPKSFAGVTMLQYGQTVIHPVALGFTLMAGVLMLLLPRRYVIVPFVVAAIFIPIQQRLVIASLDFFMLRILLLFGWARLIVRSEHHGVHLNTLDKAMILWALAGTISYAFLRETSEALIYKLGLSFDALASYFMIRGLVRDFQDIQFVIKALVAISILLAAAMLIERMTGRNAFAVFGGVPETTLVREGRLRCQGAFEHPILAGTFGATLMPLFMSFWSQREGGKMLAASGFIAGTVITFTSASSGPLITALAGLAGLSLWSFRRHMCLIRWGILYSVIALHLYMNAPVWALLARANVVGGSTGYHRYHLFDQFIKHFHEWWLSGVKSTAHWGYHLFDITNQYVLIAVEGGLVTLVLFITVIVLCYRGIGQALAGMKQQWRKRILLWALGSSLFAHLVSFWGVSYFDQIVVAWYLLLAMIATASSINLKPPDGGDSLMYEESPVNHWRRRQ